MSSPSFTRCKCGRFTNYGLTCVHCRVETMGSEIEREDEEPMDDRRGDLPMSWEPDEEEED